MFLYWLWRRNYRVTGPRLTVSVVESDVIQRETSVIRFTFELYLEIRDKDIVKITAIAGSIQLD